MAERRHLIDNLTINYSGLFKASDLYNIIDQWLFDTRYDKRELRNSELLRPEGKYLDLLLLPWKKITDYAKYEIKISIIIKNLTQVEVEKEGKKIKMDKGEVIITLDGYLETDYENVWEAKPVYYFLRTLFDKYVYKLYTSRFEAGLKSDIFHLNRIIKGFFNMGRYIPEGSY